MNKKKSKALAFLLAASLLIPSVDGVVSAAELSKDNVKPVSKIEEFQEVAPEQNNTNQEGTGENVDTQNPITQNVAKIGDVQYTSLTGEEGAIAKAKDGEVIELLADVTEDITVNKNITIDGKNTYKIIGNTKLENGTLKNTILKPKDEDKTGSVLQIGSKSENTINMHGVTVEYSVVNRSGGSNVIGGNNSNITIEKCLFTNNPNNGENTIDVSNWSFGLSMGTQGSKGRFTFRNNEFRGAFRTMLPSINGKVTIDNNKFINTVQSTIPGTGNGSNKEATCITTGKTANDNFTITNNTFDNAGAFFFQNIASVSGNTFKMDEFQHYVQESGAVGKNLDLTKNTFINGDNVLLIFDKHKSEIILPVGQIAINGWSVVTSDASEYAYSCNSDGSKTFYPTSKEALKEFVNPRIDEKGEINTYANSGDKIVISEDMIIDDTKSLTISEDITIEVPAGKNLTLNSDDAMNITGTLNLVGDGKVVINKDAKLEVGDTGKLNIETTVENNGTMNNEGEITVDLGNGSITGNKIEGNGKVDYEYPSYPSYPSKPTYTHEEIVGSDRYDTAAKIADKLGSYDNIVLVNAESSMSDGLSASGLAGKENGAILLTKKDSIPKATMDRIKKVKKVYIIGGEATISQKVYDEITKNVPNIKIERLGGKTRVETSEIVAKKLGNYSDAFVVNGFKGEADAMSASAIAAKKGAPILLTNGKTSTHAKKSGVEYYVIGGNSVVDKSIADKYNAEVLAGKDRYATNKEVINEFYSGSDKVYIANGDKLVDALTASPLAKKDGIVLVNEKSDKSILKGKNTVQVGGMDFKIEFEK